MEQMRIVKQMREASKQKLRAEFGEDYDKTKVSPRYMVWENVCHCGTTLITTSTGYKYIKDVEVGELVRTHDGTYHKVLQTYKTEMQPTIKVKFQGGIVECTPNHPFLTEALTYKPIGEFKVGDRVAFKVDEPGTKSIGMPIAYAFGRWLADGSVAIRNDRRTKHRIFISTGYKKYEDLKAELSKLPWRINEHKMDWAINFTFSSDEFGELTDSAGYGARNKQVPEWVFELTAEEQAEVLRGYLAGDGHCHKSENSEYCRWSFATSSEKLAYGLCRLIRAVYHVGVSLKHEKGKGKVVIDGRTVNAHDFWRCEFTPPNAYKHNLTGKMKASKYENGYVWGCIREISEGDIQDVYNLSVEDNNTYEANGIICHNCGAYSSGTPEGADFQAVLEEIARVVLNEVPTIPIPTDGWSYAGNLEGVGEEGTPFSICWRTHDAQYWGKTVIDNCGRVVKAGTPQRRRRIALVADFGGSTAPEILFEREGLSGNPEQSGETRQGTPGTVGESVEKSSTNDGINSDPVQKTYKKDAHAKTSEDGQGWVETEVNDTLNAFDSGETRTPTLVFDMLNLNPKSDGTCQTLNAFNGTGGNNTPMVFENHGQDTRFAELGDVCTTVSATFGMGGNNTPFVVEDKSSTVSTEEPNDSQGQQIADSDGVYPTLRGCDGGGYQAGYMLDKNGKEPILLESSQNHATVQTDGVSTTLPASMGEGGGYVPMVVNSAESSGSEMCYGFEPGVAQRVDPETRFSEEVSPTLRAKMGDNQASVVYGVCSYDSNAMKSDNPHSGIYEADTSRTLDLNGGNPGCNQGGMIVLEGNGSRPSHKGDGYAESETMYTLNTTEQHAVCVEEPVAIESHPQDSRVKINSEDINQTISSNMAHDASNGGLVLQKTVAPIKESTKSYGVTTKGNGDAFIAEERHTSLSTGGGEAGQGYPCVLTEQAEPTECLNGWDVQSKHIQSEDGVAESLYAAECRYGGGESYVMQKRTYQDTNDITQPDNSSNVITMTDVGFVDVDENGTAFTLRARDYKSPQCVAIDMGGGKSGCGISEEQAPTLTTTTHGGEPAVYGFKPDQGSKAHGMGFEEEKSPTLSTCNNAGVLSIENHPNDSRIKVRDDGTVQTLSSRMGTGGNNTPMVMATEPQAFSQNQREEVRDLGNKAGAVSAEHGTHQQTFVSTAVVRRLTPGECELLQGFPRNWTYLGEWTDTKGKKHKDSDSARYKALGNSIALPFWDWMAGRMCDQLRQSGVEHPTLMSLFAGIGGFELVYARHGCKCLSSSEIEEFPIAVLKKHFGDDETNQPGDYGQYINNPTPFYIQNRPSTCLGLDRASFNQGQNAKYDFSVEDNLAQTLVSRGPGGVMTQ